MSNSGAQEDVLDLNLRVMDPHRYFENLKNLRQRVIDSSEFFRSRGQYKPSRAISADYLTVKPSSVSAEVWERCGALASHDNPRAGISKSEKSQEDLALFVKTYLILSRIVDSLDLLARAKFCGDYYSLLLEHPKYDLAEIIRLPRKMISDFKESLEPVLLGSTHETVDQLLKHTEEQCSTILALLGGINRPASTTRSSDQFFWMTAVLLDLALVSYVGSHGLHFGLGIKESSQFSVEVSGSFGFRCQLSRTACLNEFLDDKKIWTFHVFENSSVKAKGRLSILSHIEEFADLWGPVWAETVSTENHGLIKWYTVSKGYICRVENDDNTFRGAKQCHWNFEACIYQELLGEPRESEDQCLHKDDLLLIGSHLVENEDCTYSMGEFAQTYRGGMGYLATRPAAWKLDSRTLGVSFLRLFGFQIQVSQKLVPTSNLKDSLSAMWKGNMEKVNPMVLNKLLGVEVSHCTGNARRVTLKSILLNKAIQPLLERWKPGWKKTQWGVAFREALCSRDSGAVSELWSTHAKYQLHIADLVHSVLELLQSTGAGDGDAKFRAAFLYRYELAVDLHKYGNEWAKCLSDSETTAAYVLLSETCLECRTPDYPTSVCGNSRGYTVLQTQVHLQKQHDLSLLRLLPQDLVLARVDEDAPKQETVLMVITSPIKRLLSLLSKSKVAGYEVMDELPQPEGTVSVCVQASTKQFGGMEFHRYRKAQPDESIQASSFTSSESIDRP